MSMRGYFGIGIDGASKQGNVGNLIRTGHAFGASFVFAVKPKRRVDTGSLVTAPFSDTSKTKDQIPFYTYDNPADIVLPKGCKLIGVEITDDAIDLPSFQHPTQAVYILGGERSSLSPDMAALCDHIIKIPTKFCLNVATAGAIVMYDRHRTMGGYAERPIVAGQEPIDKKPHVHGGPISRIADGRAKKYTKNKG